MKTTDELRTHGLVLLTLLAGQYVLGILTNLFVTFPDTTMATQRWEFARGQLLLMAHIVVGVLLLAGAIALLVRAIKVKDQTWIVASSIGLGSILFAIVTGSVFVSTQQASYSLIMSLLFIVAAAAFGWGIYARAIKK